ncbi:MAG TPA: DUF5752 family protein [Clostridia bacterium]|nr:DUF5752 family protein [Clostridia bacterium]
MATAQMPVHIRRWAKAPFYFNTAAHLLRIGRERATNLQELLEGLRTCPEDSIFQHTFRTLQEHHFIREGFSNDFAHWAFFSCNEVGLAERLSSIDIREFTSLKSLRERIVKTVDDYLTAKPRARERLALEPFYFCASDTVVIPTTLVARNLNEFVDGIRQISVHGIHYHFIEARLRLKLNSNDFSLWLERELDMGKLADRLNRIDIYTSTLQEVRNQIVRVLQAAL